MPLKTSCFILCSVFALHGQTDFSARIAEADKVIQRFYRGESIDALRERSNREIEVYNTQVQAVNAELAKAKTAMEQAQAPAREAYAQLQEMDKGLKDVPDGNDQEGNRRFNARMEVRNAAAHRINELNARAKASAIDQYNALATGKQGGLNQERQRVLAIQEALNTRSGAYETFTKGGKDVAFFISLNGLLAEIRQAQRRSPTDQGLQKCLAQVRGLRRELATWAVAAQSRQPSGLVIVEALVEDEPCWLIVDTGAMDTILSQELATAAGLGDAMGTENSLVVVGGQRILGRAFQIPRLTVGDQVQTMVKASAVRPSDVGLDGLLGQSFLKGFVYTIDERNPAKLLLKRR